VAVTEFTENKRVMYCLVDKGMEMGEGAECREAKRFIVCWEGFVFVKGEKPGKPSIDAFMTEMGRSDLHRTASILSGSFVCFAQDKETDTWYAFSNGSCAPPLFYTEDAVSSSFLELAHRNHLGIEDMTPFSIVESILTGLQFYNKTSFDQIKVLDTEEILEASPGRAIQDGANDCGVSR